MINSLEIYTDGSCISNPGKGAYGWVLIENNQVIKSYVNTEEYTTNNRMELKAAISAVKHNVDNLMIYTDSIYVKNGITIWIHSWIKSKWKNNKIKNIDLWKQLLELIQNKNIQWFWVKAHSTNEFNNTVDQMVNKAARSIN